MWPFVSSCSVWERLVKVHQQVRRDDVIKPGKDKRQKFEQQDDFV